jgi:hypothetical protein
MKTAIFDRVQRRIDRVQRRWFVKRYIRRMIKRTEADHRIKMRAAQSLPAVERWNLQNYLNQDLFELLEWEQNIEDRELIATSNKIGVDIREIPRPDPEEHQVRSLWKVTSHGSEVLYDESRREIRRQVRERMPEYLKERRDAIDFYIKIITLVVTVMTGFVGAATGLVALLKK